MTLPLPPLSRCATALLAIALGASAQDTSPLAASSGSNQELSNLGALFSQSLAIPAASVPVAQPQVAPRPAASTPPRAASTPSLPTPAPPSGAAPAVPSADPGRAAAAAIAAGVAFVLPPHAAQLAQLRSSNPFDADRRLWPDRIPPPPPPAPPPAPTPISEDDMQLYGVTIVGPRRLATVKVGSRFAQMAPPGRAFVTLAEGQAAGEFTVQQVAADRLVLGAAGSQQVLHFTRKADRGGTPVANAVPTPVQGATEPPAPVAGGSAVPSQQPAAAGPTASPPAAANAAPAVSLVEALAAARARAAQNPTQGAPVAGSPFTPSGALPPPSGQ